jgi:hypothetical protein
VEALPLHIEYVLCCSFSCKQNTNALAFSLSCCCVSPLPVLEPETSGTSTVIYRGYFRSRVQYIIVSTVSNSWSVLLHYGFVLFVCFVSHNLFLFATGLPVYQEMPGTCAIKSRVPAHFTQCDLGGKGGYTFPTQTKHHS